MKNYEMYQYQLLEKLCFPRFGGTDGELRAARLIQDEIAALGGQSRLMPFDIPTCEIERCAMTANGKNIPCVAMGHSGQFQEGGMELSLKYVESNTEAAFLSQGDLNGCAVLVNTFDLDMYRALVERRAAAIIEIDNSKWYEDKELVSNEMRPDYLAVGQVPVFTIGVRDAMELVDCGTETVHLELRQRSFTTTSHNILATVEGSGDTAESIVLTAHYDTTPTSPGACDNGSGAVTLLYIYRHFLKNRPRRTMRFLWCGSEEQGLQGSRAYVAAQGEELANVRLCYNLDSVGTILGENNIDIAGSDALKELTEQLCKEWGFVTKVFVFPDASDSAPFADKGIPAVCPGRIHWTSNDFHTRWDTIETVSAKRLHEMGEFSVFYLERFVNADAFPVEREMPEELAQKLDALLR